MRPRGHKQKKWINMVIHLLLFVSSKPRCYAEFKYIESGLFVALALCKASWAILQLTHAPKRKTIKYNP